MGVAHFSPFLSREGRQQRTHQPAGSVEIPWIPFSQSCDPILSLELRGPGELESGLSKLKALSFPLPQRQPPKLSTPEYTVELKGASLAWAPKDKSSKKNVLEVSWGVERKKGGFL